jgi:hypothetical protein
MGLKRDAKKRRQGTLAAAPRLSHGREGRGPE